MYSRGFSVHHRRSATVTSASSLCLQVLWAETRAPGCNPHIHRVNSESQVGPNPGSFLVWGDIANHCTTMQPCYITSEFLLTLWMQKRRLGRFIVTKEATVLCTVCCEGKGKGGKEKLWEFSTSWKNKLSAGSEPTDTHTHTQSGWLHTDGETGIAVCLSASLFLFLPLTITTVRFNRQCDSLQIIILVCLCLLMWVSVFLSSHVCCSMSLNFSLWYLSVLPFSPFFFSLLSEVWTFHGNIVQKLKVDLAHKAILLHSGTYTPFFMC